MDFDPSHSPQVTHVFAVGDVMLADAAQPYLETHGYDYPFRNLQPYFQPADLIVGNLEAPITQAAVPLANKRYAYKAAPNSAAALKAFGFDLFCLANNHILDYGPEGLGETRSLLAAEGIGFFGAGPSYREAIAPKIVTVNDTRIGFLGFMRRYRSYAANYPDYFAQGERSGVAPIDEQTVRPAIQALRDQVEILIVNFHWGRNYQPVLAHQKQWGRWAIDWGADLVVGHHPHVAQGVEVYRDAAILYSLGNFTFGAPGRFRKVDPLWHYGWIADLAICRGRIRAIDLIPIQVNNQVVHFQPRVAEQSLEQLIPFLNQEFGTTMEIRDGHARLELPQGSRSQSSRLQGPVCPV